VGRRKPAVEPPIDPPTATAVASSGKRAQRPKQTSATRTKAARAAGRASGGAKAVQAPAVEELVTFETEVVVDASAIVEEMTIAEVPFAPPIEALTFPSSEVQHLLVSEERRPPPLPPAAAGSAALAAPAPEHGKRALVAVVSRLLSTLFRWAGVRL
jgi:hypothetical protein